MKLDLRRNGSAAVTEVAGKKEEIRHWETNDPKHTAAHLATWDHKDKKRQQMSKGDLSALRDFHNEHTKKK